VADFAMQVQQIRVPASAHSGNSSQEIDVAETAKLPLA
jgi:hypothetical protein